MAACGLGTELAPDYAVFRVIIAASSYSNIPSIFLMRIATKFSRKSSDDFYYYYSVLARNLCSSFKTIPTTDIYFLNSNRERSLQREGVNSFSTRDTVVVCRRDHPGVVERLLNEKTKRLYYVIDDNLWAADHDVSLPELYRQRLLSLRNGQHNKLATAADTIVVPSPALFEVYEQQGFQVKMLDPFWSEALSTDWCFHDLPADAPLRIGYLGTASHAADRKFVLEIFENLLATGANVELTIVGDHDVPPQLSTHPKLRVLRHLDWYFYRKRLFKHRFDVLLYPVIPSSFNDARSANKLAEHAVCGGVGVYSDSWAYADFVRINRVGLVWKNNVRTWVDNLLSLSIERNFQDLVGSLTPVHDRNEIAGREQKAFWSACLDNSQH